MRKPALLSRLDGVLSALGPGRRGEGHSHARRVKGRRLSFEPLENRSLLSVTTRVWDGGSMVDNNWMTPANWVGDEAPQPGDALQVQRRGPHRDAQ